MPKNLIQWQFTDTPGLWLRKYSPTSPTSELSDLSASDMDLTGT